MKITVKQCYKDYETPHFDGEREVELYNSKKEAIKALDAEKLPILDIDEYPSRWEHPYEWIQKEAENENYVLISRRKCEHIRRMQENSLIAYRK